MGTDIVELVMAPSILSNIAGSYPKIGDLLRYNPRGTLSLLHAAKAVTFRRLRKQITVKHEGNDNIKAWREYNNAIKKYLFDINSDEILKPAREAVADLIHETHFLEYPMWPAEGCEQKSHVCVESNGNYNIIDSSVNVYWSVLGYITVKDQRPSQSQYIAEFDGKPEMKAVQVDNAKMRLLDMRANEDFDRMKKKVDQMHTELTWEDIDKLTTTIVIA